jgi:uncharacterized protein YbcV (DUF1398 family)
MIEPDLHCKERAMDARVVSVMEECSKASDESALTFPQVVGKLMEAGIEWYHADLLRSEKTYYMPDGESRAIPNAAVSRAPARQFSAPAVDAAVRAIQAQSIDYKEFCERIGAAGCVGYFVSFPGRQAIYFGRTGESHIEPFPNK